MSVNGVLLNLSTQLGDQSGLVDEWAKVGRANTMLASTITLPVWRGVGSVSLTQPRLVFLKSEVLHVQHRWQLGRCRLICIVKSG